MKVLGITGSLGTGKSTASRMFGRLGAKVLDADHMVREALKNETALKNRVIRSFGKGVLTGGRIDRNKLAGIVFGDKRKLKTLCDIVYPTIIRQIRTGIRQFKKKDAKAVVIDAPMLIEAGLVKDVDILIVVRSGKTIQLKRIKARGRLSGSEALKRIRNQMPLRRKVKLADFIIDNNASKAKLRQQVKRIWDTVIKKEV